MQFFYCVLEHMNTMKMMILKPGEGRRRGEICVDCSKYFSKNNIVPNFNLQQLLSVQSRKLG